MTATSGLLRGRRSRPFEAEVGDDVRLAWQLASLLIDHPDQALVARAGVLRIVAGGLPSRLGGPLLEFLDTLTGTDLLELQTRYAETFDLRRRCCPYLTYYAYGDTRKRGMALLRFQHAYKAAGLTPPVGELPDHLAVVLEFGATADPQTARRLLIENRAGLELLRLALRDSDSPWAPILATVSATLPDLAGNEREAVARLAAQGPPAEEVGLEPYGPPVSAPVPTPSTRTKEGF